MSDFLATLAAQALSAAPVAHPLVPARYAPMPPIGGVGTLEGLRAGGDMAASSAEGPPPGQDRLDLPPPLIEPGAHDTGYYPFSYLQLQQAGGHQATAVEPGIEPPALATESEAATDVTPTEPALDADAGRSTIVSSSAPAGASVHPVTDAAGPPAPIAEPLVAIPPPIQQPAAAASSPSSARQSPIEDAAPNHDMLVAMPLQTAATASLEAPRNPPGDPQAAMPVTASTTSLGELVQRAADSHQEPVSRPEVVAPPPAARSPRLDMAGPPTPGDASVHVPSASPAAAVTPATEEQAPPEASANPPPAERNVFAPDHVASPRPEVTEPAFPANPTADADALPGPAPANATQAPAGPGHQPQALQTQPPADATPFAPRSEVVVSSPLVRSRQMDVTGLSAPGGPMARLPSKPPSVAVTPMTAKQQATGQQPAKADAAERVPPTMPDAAARPSTVIQQSPVAPDHMPTAEAAQSSGTVLGAKDQPPALLRSPEPLAPQPAQAAVARPEIAAVVQPELGTERGVPAPDHVTSPRPQVAVPAFPAKPAADAELSPRPSVTGATPLVPRPAVVEAAPATRSPLSQTADSFSMEAPGEPAGTPMDENASTGRGVRRIPRTPELVRAFSGQAPRRPAGTSTDENQRARSETGPSDDERVFSGQAPRRPAGTSTDENQRARSETGPSDDARAFSKQAPRRPAGTSMDENQRARSETGPSDDARAFSKQAPRRPAGTSTDENQRARSETGPSDDERVFSKQGHALPAEAAKSLGSVSADAGHPPPPVRPAESMAPLAAWGQGQTTAHRLEQASEQPAPATNAKPSAAAPNAPASMLSPLKGPELARAASDGPEASRSRPGGEQAVVRPVLPAGNDTPAGQGMAGRNDPNREPAPLPTIRVTIGRIEVRSSSPTLPAAASSPARPRPALSLDNYLKRPAKVRP